MDGASPHADQEPTPAGRRGASRSAGNRSGQVRKHWDIFVEVIDNWGDVGVCWRLARALAGAGQRVRIWLDDPTVLDWMAPDWPAGSGPAIEVLPWARAAAADTHAVDVLVEAFACNPPDAYLASFAASARARVAQARRAPTWLNLEYLSAEAYVERSHGLPSPQMHGPAAGLTKHFFYPGFTAASGGLLRTRGRAGDEVEPGNAWRWQRLRALAQAVDPWPATAHVVSLFCYEPKALQPMLELGLSPQVSSAAPTDVLLVAAGRTAHAVERWTANARAAGRPPWQIVRLPLLAQTAYDELLTLCDFNFVRGEDSLVTALHAGKPLLWQAYVQDGGAHEDKLEALLRWAAAAGFDDPGWHAAMRRWNGFGAWSDAPVANPWQAAWAVGARALQQNLRAQSDLLGRLMAFANTHAVYN